MPIKLYNEKVDPVLIHPSKLRGGTICMKHKTDLIYPGEECYWGDVSVLDKRARVRVLPVGTTIEVVDHE